MKAGRDISSGFVSLRTSKCNEGAKDPILKARRVVVGCRNLGKKDGGFGDEGKTKDLGELCEFSRIYLLVGVAGIKSGL
jgi:hypothetical protein